MELLSPEVLVVPSPEVLPVLELPPLELELTSVVLEDASPLVALPDAVSVLAESDAVTVAVSVVTLSVSLDPPPELPSVSVSPSDPVLQPSASAIARRPSRFMRWSMRHRQGSRKCRGRPADLALYPGTTVSQPNAMLIDPFFATWAFLQVWGHITIMVGAAGLS